MQQPQVVLRRDAGWAEALCTVDLSRKHVELEDLYSDNGRDPLLPLGQYNMKALIQDCPTQFIIKCWAVHMTLTQHRRFEHARAAWLEVAVHAEDLSFLFYAYASFSIFRDTFFKELVFLATKSVSSNQKDC